jgi:hypothetical protein
MWNLLRNLLKRNRWVDIIPWNKFWIPFQVATRSTIASSPHFVRRFLSTFLSFITHVFMLDLVSHRFYFLHDKFLSYPGSSKEISSGKFFVWNHKYLCILLNVHSIKTFKTKVQWSKCFMLGTRCLHNEPYLIKIIKFTLTFTWSIWTKTRVTRSRSVQIYQHKVSSKQVQ